MTAVDAADPCPECGYDRRGGDAGRPCPECGYRQPADEFVAWGWSDKEVGVPRRNFVRYMVLWVAGYVAVSWLLIANDQVVLFRLFNLLFVIANLVWQAGYSLWPRIKGVVLGRCQQLRYSPRGFAVRTGRGPVSPVRWSKRHRVAVEAAAVRPRVIVERRLVGRLLVDRAFVFIPNSGDANAIAGRIELFLEQGDAMRAARTVESCNR